MEFHHSIHVAAKKAGLTAHVVRAWEKRYDAVSPDRTDTNRRLYSDAEIERLRLLGVATKHGHRIGDIAKLPTDKLVELVSSPQDGQLAGGRSASFAPASDGVEEALEAVEQMDSRGIQSVLERYSVAFGQRGLLERVISPLARRIGEKWASGELTAGHEHFATNCMRSFLLHGARAYAEGGQTPVAIVTTPAGQLHELGAAMIAAMAEDFGWRVLYLGPNLPAADIAQAAVAAKARAVALSIVYPGDDANLPNELAQLRKLLPAETDIVAGGAASASYDSALRSIRIKVMDDLDAFGEYLMRVRMPLQGRRPTRRSL